MRILLVEDDQIDRKQMERLLKASTLFIARIVHADSMQACLDLIEKEDFDALLLDLNLPDSNGLDTVVKIHQAHSYVPIIVVTGEGGDDVGLKAVAYGAQDYLVKGEFDDKMLARIVRYAHERKKQNEVLRRQKDFAESLIQTAPVLVLVLDIDGRIVQFNSYMEGLLGRRLQDVRGQECFEVFISPEHRDSSRQIIARILDLHHIEGVVIPILLSDGSERQVEWYARTLLDSKGEVLGLLAIGMDVTDRKRTEEELQFRNTLLSTQQEVSIDGILVVDEKSRVLLFNQRFLDMWNIPPEVISTRSDELVLKSVLDKLVNPQGFLQKVNYLYENRDQASRDEITLKDGRTLDRYSAPMIGPGQKYYGRVWYFHEITEHKQAELSIRQANEQLEGANRELKEMQAQIVQSEKLASIGQLAAGVAHEMNTPVGFVASNFQTLQKYMTKLLDLLHQYEALGEAVEDGLKERRLEIAGQIQKARKDLKIDFLLEDIGSLFEESKEGLHRVSEIIQNLRDFSRIDQAEESAEYNINEGIKATLGVARNEIKDTAEVRLDIGDIPPIPCRAGQINQVFLNVLINAAQAIQSQGRSEKGTICIHTIVEGDSVVCRIDDDGPGIPVEIISKIFDPFFTTKPVGSGTGLGLSIAYDIVVSKHHGQIEVNSVVGQGTTFTISLPIKQTQALQPEPASAGG